MPSSSISRIASRYSSVASWCSATRRAPSGCGGSTLLRGFAPDYRRGTRVVWQVVESASVAAPIGLVWNVVSDFERHPRLAGSGEVRDVRLHGPAAPGSRFDSDVATGEAGSFVSRNRIDVVDEPRELRWTSYPPL